jgi:GNAT superfamily N-acetyltransferase
VGDLIEHHNETDHSRGGVSDQSAVRVRPAGLADAAAVAAVHVAGWEGAYRGMIPDEAFEQRTVERRTAMWGQLLGTPADPIDGTPPWVAVAERQGTTIGFIALVVPAGESARSAMITALYVTPTAWRHGAGTALMGAALDQATARGCVDVTLWVLEPNLRARGFYERCGFADDGGRQTDREDWPVELRMRRAV